ncbi:MAG: NAD(P)/FAD-dependent oxidoreductase [Clostridiales bacterium]|nr:NAD(P)/FAD-dependent oxidoreductase [Clostridiales bacterium]
MRYDIAVIGTGPAGISAAITAKIRNKTIILFGSRHLSDKLVKAHRIDNYPGLPQISGEDFGKKLLEQIESLGIEITEKKVAAVYSMGDYFTIQADNDIIEASSVIVASGIVQDAAIKGEEEFLGRGVSYCATCDGRLYKGKDVAVLGYNDSSAEEAEYLSEIVNKVLFFPMGSKIIPERANIEITEEKPIEVKGAMKAQSLITDKGEHQTDCIFVLRDAIKPANLIPGIETDGPHIKVDLQMQTNVKGLFACGDIAGRPYQYVKAAGQGNVAALSAVKYINGIK